MKLEEQVCSLELARKLKELGVKQESLFYITSAGTVLHNPAPKPLESYSAYTVAELGEMLPGCLTAEKWKHWNNELVITRQPDKWVFEYQAGDAFSKGVRVNANTEADARAKMLIYLLENKLIEVL